jgi:hypothetical protein
MVITIAILALLGMILSIGENVRVKEKVDVNIIFPAILTIVLWDTNITLSIVTICITVIIGIAGLKQN